MSILVQNLHKLQYNFLMQANFINHTKYKTVKHNKFYYTHTLKATCFDFYKVIIRPFQKNKSNILCWICLNVLYFV